MINLVLNKSFLYNIRKHCRQLVNQKILPPIFYVMLFNLETSLCGRNNLKIAYKADHFQVSELHNGKFILWSFPRSNRIRGWLYAGGLINRANDLAEGYGINKLNFKDDDLIIDCGANFADLWLYLNTTKKNLQYIAIEPGFDEFQAISRNLDFNSSQISSQGFDVALSDHSGSSVFYYSPNGADSSLVKPFGDSKEYNIECITLTKLLFDLDLSNRYIKLLKLEAEGWEPEILEGASEIISKIEYIAADVGPERGENKENTLSNVANILYKHNFLIYSSQITGYRITLLFKNQRLENL